jgi:hypothetical protein
VSSADQQSEAALAGLIERLLVDPEFRAEFRRDPAEVCAAAGSPGLAAELGGSGEAMHTVELRESRSSLAGVVCIDGQFYESGGMKGAWGRGGGVERIGKPSAGYLATFPSVLHPKGL